MKISVYAVMILLSFVLSFIMAFILMIKKGIRNDLALCSIFLDFFCIIIGAKTYTVLASGWAISFQEAGLSSLGGAIGLLTGMFLFNIIYPEKKREVICAYMIILPLLYGVSKLGCHFAGCCHGIDYNGPLAITYNNDVTQGGPFFPVQLAESVAFIILFLIIVVLYIKKNPDNILAYTILACAIVKFTLEFLREAHAGRLLTINQYVCLGFFVWGIVLIIISLVKKKENSFVK